MYQDLSMCHDWPVKKAIVNLVIRLKGNFENHFVVIGDPEQEHGCCFPDVT